MDTETGQTTTTVEPVRIRLIGGSMSPTLSLGEVVEIVSWSRPRVGQVALIAARPHPILHRLVGRFSIRRRTWFLHAGDAASIPGLARSEDILGITRTETAFRIPAGHRLLTLVMNLFGPVASLGLDPRFLFPSRILSDMFSATRFGCGLFSSSGGKSC